MLLSALGIDADADRDKYAADPVSWVRDKLGEHPWSRQCQILESVRDHRRTAVKSCHGSGKSWLAARLAAWWIVSHPPGEAFVVTSAPTWKQVRAVLWREIGRAHARGHLAGRVNQAEWLMVMPAGNEETVAFGLKPADYDPAAFQGIHALYVLVIFDEACGMPELLWSSADSLISNDYSRFLAIGNPDDPATEFCEVCKPGSGWNVVRISAFDTPNFTSEVVPDKMRHVLVGRLWVEEKRRKWGETNPLYISKVLGDFPEVVSDGLIPMKWIRAAQERDLPAGSPTELGVDVGGGGDRSVIACRRGPVVRVIHRDHNPDTMQTLGATMSAVAATGATCAKIDSVGIGKGAADRAAEIAADPVEPPGTRARARAIHGVGVGQASSDPESFSNLRAEGFWALRERFETGDIDIDADDDDLAAQLVDLRFKRTSRGQIQIESKEEMRRRGKDSPDDADAVMLSFLPLPEDADMPLAVWGRNKEAGIVVPDRRRERR